MSNFLVFFFLSIFGFLGSSRWRAMAETGFCDAYIRIVDGYDCSEFNATTSDGYVLSFQRVGWKDASASSRDASRTGQKVPVLLEHAMFLGGEVWFNLLPDKIDDKNLPFFLAKHGFDVWITHHRGNRYSYDNIRLSTDSREFWEWSVDELAAIDLPTMINLVKEKTQTEKIHLVGFNQGGMLPILMTSTHPSLASSLLSCVFIAPAVYFIDTPSPSIYKWANAWTPDYFIYATGINHIEYNITITENFVGLLNSFGISFTDFVTTGGTVDQMIRNTTGPNCCLGKPASVALNRTDSNWVVGSYRLLIHYQQLIRTGRLQKWDYMNNATNLVRYSSFSPPQYYPSQVPKNLPILILNGGNDWWADAQNVNRLISQLQGKVKHVFLPQYAHLDMMYSTSVEEDVFTPIKDYLQGGYLHST